MKKSDMKHELFNPQWMIGKASALGLRAIVLVGFCLCTMTSRAIEKQTMTTLTNQNLVLGSAYELHLTSPSAPFSNSTVNLTHEDAWLFFDNIRPSEVMANYLPNILINGSPLNPGVNGRVAIYVQGTVVMPHASGFSPLTVYTGDNFTGSSMQMSINTYNSLGSFNNTIKSFKLKRGYMVTLANNADGTNYSRVFIADESDLEFSVAPVELYGTISYVRVFKHEFVSKKGWCEVGNGAGTVRINADKTKSTWYYSWSADQYSTSTLEYAMIKQHLYWPGWSEIYGKANCTHLMGYNEPEHAEQHSSDKCSCGGVISTDKTISVWPDYLKSGLRLGSPSPTDPNWLYDFVAKCDANNQRLDYVAYHCYWGGKSASSWYNDLKTVHERTGRPIWITEWNNGANWTSEWWPSDTASQFMKQYNDMKAILNVLDTAHFVERYAIYNWVQNKRAMILGDTLTRAGVYYKNNKSRLAYNKVNRIIPVWNYYEPSLSYVHLSASNKIRLSWTDSNGEMTKGYKIEKKVNEGSYSTVYESNDVSVLAYNDPVASDVEGKITYRLSISTVYGTSKSSNTVAYFQTSGVSNVQVGQLPLLNSDWSMSLFSQKFAVTPMVIMGTPSFNNVSPVTLRVRSVLVRSFEFHLENWVYLNNPVYTKSENLAVMALPSGNYDFGGLQAESGAIPDVDSAWVQVAFVQAFDTVPAVFCSQVTNSTSFPTTVAVRNVTKTGFELQLRCEEAVTNAILKERINYLAVEPGDGVVEGKRISVGYSVGLDVGNTLYPYDISFDASFTKPALFAGLMTASDDITSTLRYSIPVGTTKFRVVKQREISKSLASVSKDRLCWLVIDLAPDQITSVRPDLLKPLTIYPNPSEDVIYLNLEKPSLVAVLDMNGRKVLEKMVLDGLNIQELKTGIYNLSVDGLIRGRFVKK